MYNLLLQTPPPAVHWFLNLAAPAKEIIAIIASTIISKLFIFRQPTIFWTVRIGMSFKVSEQKFLYQCYRIDGITNCAESNRQYFAHRILTQWLNSETFMTSESKYVLRCMLQHFECTLILIEVLLLLTQIPRHLYNYINIMRWHHARASQIGINWIYFQINLK